jgi:hypothetical protein
MINLRYLPQQSFFPPPPTSRKQRGINSQLIHQLINLLIRSINLTLNGGLFGSRFCGEFKQQINAKAPRTLRIAEVFFQFSLRPLRLCVNIINIYLHSTSFDYSPFFIVNLIQLIHQIINLFICRIDLTLDGGFFGCGLCSGYLFVQLQHFFS